MDRARSSNKNAYASACDVNFELAVCYHLGFGTSRHLEGVQKHMEFSARTNEDLQNEVDRIKTMPDMMRRTKLAETVAEGYVEPLNYASYGRDLQRLEEAKQHHEVEIADLSIALGEHHEHVLALKMFESRLLRDLGELQRATELVTQVVASAKIMSGADSHRTLGSMNALAILLWRHQRLDEAEDVAKQTCNISERVRGPNFPSTLSYLSTLSFIFNSQGQYNAAEKTNQRVLQGFESTLGVEHPRTILSASNLALVLNS